MDIKQFIVKNYLKKEENLLIADKLFMAISVIQWAETQYTDKKIIFAYLEEVKKYLKGEINLFWKDGTIHKEPVKKRGKK